MKKRAEISGVTLSEYDASLVKGMLARGDRQHDIAAWFGVNGGRIGEISTGARFSQVVAAPLEALPPQGPYGGIRETVKVLDALAGAKSSLAAAEAALRSQASRH